jgi:hypothetical protein
MSSIYKKKRKKRKKRSLRKRSIAAQLHNSKMLKDTVRKKMSILR